MAAHKDPGDGTAGRPAQRGVQPSHMSWLPMPEAPANDNDIEVFRLSGALLRRHARWLAPTMLLTVVQSLPAISVNRALDAPQGACAARRSREPPGPRGGSAIPRRRPGT